APSDASGREGILDRQRTCAKKVRRMRKAEEALHDVGDDEGIPDGAPPAEEAAGTGPEQKNRGEDVWGATTAMLVQELEQFVLPRPADLVGEGYRPGALDDEVPAAALDAQTRADAGG